MCLSSMEMLLVLLLLLPLALVFERKNDTKITLPVLRDICLLGLLGVVLGKTPYFVGLEYTTPTFASAMANLIPSITFIVAVLCRMEKVEISKHGTGAKIVGTGVAFAGAALMTLYKDINLISTHSLIDRKKHSHQTTSKLSSDKKWIEGSLMLFLSNFSLSAFYILQGVVIFTMTVYVQTLVTQQRGPVFMTACRPLSTIIVAIFGLLILGKALHLGSIVGAMLIILGLYAILSGKEKEEKQSALEQ